MLDHFQRYLQENASIPKKHIPFYLKWVGDCYTFFQQSLEKRITQDEKREFLKHLSRSHEDWQVKQADYALRLYGFFLAREDRKRGSGEKGTLAEKEWAKIEDDTRKALRLRHRSLSTEKSYLIWLRQFRERLRVRSTHFTDGGRQSDNQPMLWCAKQAWRFLIGCKSLSGKAWPATRTECCACGGVRC